MSPPVMEIERRDDGTISTRCQECKTQVILDPAGEPMREGSLAERMGLAIAKTGVLCDHCASRVEAAEERAKHGRSYRARLSDSGLPKPLQGMTFDDMYSDGDRFEAVSAAKGWADNGGQLVFYGPTGVGKTRLAATACDNRLRYESIKWVSVAVLLAELGASFGDAGRREAIKTITGEHGLILDDFDKVNPTEWARNQLFAAIDRRVQAKKTLLVTTNLDPKLLRERFGEPIASRLGGMKTIEVVGPDYRMQLGETL